MCNRYYQLNKDMKNYKDYMNSFDIVKSKKLSINPDNFVVAYQTNLVFQKNFFNKAVKQ